MTWLIELYRSPVAKKAVMAVTGVMLFGFVLVHMAGNLKLYQGPEKLNAYAEWLRTVGTPAVPAGQLLNVARAGLLAALVLHVVSAWQVTLLSRRARPSRYARLEVLEASYASRTMRWGGVIILLYAVYHLLHLTWGTAHPSFTPGDVYGNVVSGFQVPWVAAVYIGANLALGLHLYHGLWSLFQSLGINHPALNPARRPFAAFFAVVVTAGNVSFPIAVLTGLVN